jgi:hypothetical protein
MKIKVNPADNFWSSKSCLWNRKTSFLLSSLSLTTFYLTFRLFIHLVFGLLSWISSLSRAYHQVLATIFVSWDVKQGRVWVPSITCSYKIQSYEMTYTESLGCPLSKLFKTSGLAQSYMTDVLKQNYA